MDAELLESLESCLDAARDVDDSLPKPQACEVESNPAIAVRLQWIERQLSTLTSKLKAMQEDMDAGLSMNEMGFADPQEMQELLNDMGIQIAHLKSMCLALVRSLGRGI
ncbi:hypothetical protein BLA13014_07565 [Burkholderia aenigmatica]|uniref:Uncharacterized protein n=1 Tax=Burkholderia aenigmatica TaxID=2015348 RepID=A0A6P2SVM9_9BURK|nr:hypothetical protein [Burkholderia aenigmatica]VWC49184.1 hypothetical protein BLA13014_07565 [Burkholderia aenigmatica]